MECFNIALYKQNRHNQDNNKMQIMQKDKKERHTCVQMKSIQILRNELLVKERVVDLMNRQAQFSLSNGKTEPVGCCYLIIFQLETKTEVQKFQIYQTETTWVFSQNPKTNDAQSQHFQNIISKIKSRIIKILFQQEMKKKKRSKGDWSAVIWACVEEEQGVCSEEIA